MDIIFIVGMAAISVFAIIKKQSIFSDQKEEKEEKEEELKEIKKEIKEETKEEINNLKEESTN